MTSAAAPSSTSSSSSDTCRTRSRRRLCPRNNEFAPPGPAPPGRCPDPTGPDSATKTTAMALASKSTKKRRLGAPTVVFHRPSLWLSLMPSRRSSSSSSSSRRRRQFVHATATILPLLLVLLLPPPTAYDDPTTTAYTTTNADAAAAAATPATPSFCLPGVDAFRITDSQQQRRYHLQLQQPMLLYKQHALVHQQVSNSAAAAASASSSRSPPFFLGRRLNSSRSTTTILFMGKGDGKKKRPKKKKNSGGGPGGVGGGGGGVDVTASSSSSSSSSTPSPQRVTTDLNIPIRRQIMYGKLNKALRTGTSGTAFRQPKKVRTSYRRSWNETEIETAAEARRRKGQEVDWELVLNSTLWKNPPLVLVDGYNIINKWPRLKKHFVKGDLERSRQLLCDDLENLAELKGWRIEVVFDAARSSPSGQSGGNVLGTNPKAVRSTLQQRLSPSKEVLKHGRVRTIFTGSGIEADSYIEGRCLDAKNILKNDDGKLIQSLIVATDDNMIRVCASSSGAVLMSASRFVTELKACQHSTQFRVELAMSQVNNMPMRPEKLWNSNVFVQSNYRNDNFGNNGSNGKTDNDDGNVIDDEILGKVHKVETKNDGSTVYVPRFGSGSVIIEDRRNRNRNRKNNNRNQNQNQNLQNNDTQHSTKTSTVPSPAAPASNAESKSNSSSSRSLSSMFDILGEYKDPQQQQQQQDEQQQKDGTDS